MSWGGMTDNKCIICKKVSFADSFRYSMGDYDWAMWPQLDGADIQIICSECSGIIIPTLKNIRWGGATWKISHPDSIIFSGDDASLNPLIKPHFRTITIEHKIEHLRNLIEINKFLE